MIGRRFGRLIVQDLVGRNCHRKLTWKCLCDCGVATIVVGSSLRSGLTKSCGCFRKTHAITHGLSRNGTPEYRIWASILSRCKENGHKNYGGRGIRVCRRWLIFENFFADMGLRPSPKHSIDRKDNNGDYSLANCHWATKKEQDRNRRTNRRFEYNGEVKCVTEWAEKFNLHPAALSYRLDKGWSVEKALLTPSRNSHDRKRVSV